MFETRWETCNLKFNSIDVVEWGKFNESQKYWPARIRVVGSVEVEYSSGFASTVWRDREYDKINDFKLTKDDYGKWRISP